MLCGDERMNREVRRIVGNCRGCYKVVSFLDWKRELCFDCFVGKCDEKRGVKGV